MVEILVPPLTLPFPSRINPLVDETEAWLSTWARRLGMVADEASGRRLDATLLGHLAARTYPTANRMDLATAAHWMGWFFLFDDTLDDAPTGRVSGEVHRITEELVQILDHDPMAPGSGTVGSGTAEPVARALTELWRRTAPGMPAPWRERFVRHMTNYLHAYRMQARVNHSRKLLDEHGYVQHRLHSGAGFAAIDLIEVAQRAALPAEVHSTPELRMLRETTSNVVCWSNDLFSAPKELARHDLCNYVAVLHHLTGHSLQRCAELVAVRIREQVALFQDAESRLPQVVDELGMSPGPSRALYRFVEGLKAWMRGNIDWSLETARYRRRSVKDPRRAEHTTGRLASSACRPQSPRTSLGKASTNGMQPSGIAAV